MNIAAFCRACRFPHSLGLATEHVRGGERVESAMSTDTDRSGISGTLRHRFAWELPLSAGLGLGLLGTLDALWGMAAGRAVPGMLLVRVVVHGLALLLVAGVGVGLAEGLVLWLAERVARPLGVRWKHAIRIAVTGALPAVPLGVLGSALLRDRWSHLGRTTAALAVSGVALAVALSGLGAWLVHRARPWLEGDPRRRVPLVASFLGILTATVVALDRTVLVRLYEELHLALGLGACFGAQLVVLCVLRPAETRWPRWFRRPAASGLALGLGLVVTAVPTVPEVHALALERTAIHAKVLRLARALLDLDRDGYSALLGGGDCDDHNPAVHAGAVDLPENGVDEDCTGGDLTLEMLGPTAASGGGQPAPIAPGPLNILLVTVDGVRWDHLGTYGYSRITSPNIDRLADEALVFERAYAPSNNTASSFPSLLTGRHPSSSPWTFDPALEVDIGWPYLRDEDNVTLPELLAPAGFTTLAVVRGSVVFRIGLRQGFERTTELDELTPAAARGALDWVGDRRFFAWIHVDYPHHPYEPNDLVDFGEADIDRYDGEIARADAEIGNVLRLLEDRGLLERTIIVFAADHGEEFGEHGGRYHASSLHEEQIHVPLLLHIPGFHAQRIARPVGLVDVVPTLLECVGVPIPPELDGLSLLREPPPGVTTAYSEFYDGELRQRAIVSGRWKLIDDLADHRRQLYDLSSDPAEQRDLAASLPGVTAELRAVLGQIAHRKILLMLALSKRGDRGSVIQLARSLTRVAQPDLLQYAATLIGQSGVDEAVAPLAALARAGHVRPEVRLAALRALAALGGDEARATLEAVAAGEGPIPATARRLLGRSIP